MSDRELVLSILAFLIGWLVRSFRSVKTTDTPDLRTIADWYPPGTTDPPDTPPAPPGPPA